MRVNSIKLKLASKILVDGVRLRMWLQKRASDVSVYVLKASYFWLLDANACHLCTNVRMQKNVCRFAYIYLFNWWWQNLILLGIIIIIKNQSLWEKKSKKKKKYPQRSKKSYLLAKRSLTFCIHFFTYSSYHFIHSYACSNANPFRKSIFSTSSYRRFGIWFIHLHFTVTPYFLSFLSNLVRICQSIDCVCCFFLSLVC